MTEHVHFIPVGFDFERLIFPISKGELEADRVLLFHTEENEEESEARELVENMVGRLKDSFEMIDVDVDVENLHIEDLYDYEGLYPRAYGQIMAELEKGSEVHVNISSMPRSVAFAFATAADSIIAEKKEFRDNLHTYYVAPEKYLVLDILETLNEELKFLKGEYSESEDLKLYDRISKIENQLEEINRKGVTEGAKTMPNGNLYVEFPASPSRSLEEFEGELLRFLNNAGTMRSTSELAEKFADYLNEEFDESFRGRVQYYVRSLDEDGYIEREKQGNRYETRLSVMGKLWAETHTERKV